MATAVLVDGGFFLYRYRSLFGQQTPREVAKAMHKMCHDHLVTRKSREGKRRRKLFRIFYYDCPPLKNKYHNPISGRSVDFSKNEVAIWRTEFFKELKRLRRVALRLGDLNEKNSQWTIKPRKLSELLRGKIAFDELTEDDVQLNATQKGVDMRIGLDIASMCYKRFVDQIVLIAGDSDFVPAAKLARREGVDFVLDPMWAQIRDDLFEHIDGLHSPLQRPDKTPRRDDSTTSTTSTESAVSTATTSAAAPSGEGAAPRNPDEFGFGVD